MDELGENEAGTDELGILRIRADRDGSLEVTIGDVELPVAAIDIDDPSIERLRRQGLGVRDLVGG